MEYPTYLIHYGTLGQKWGVRKYQNEDGSWTEEGLRRRRKDQTDLYKSIKKDAKKGNFNTKDYRYNSFVRDEIKKKDLYKLVRDRNKEQASYNKKKSKYDKNESIYTKVKNKYENIYNKEIEEELKNKKFKNEDERYDAWEAAKFRSEDKHRDEYFNELDKEGWLGYKSPSKPSDEKLRKLEEETANAFDSVADSILGKYSNKHIGTIKTNEAYRKYVNDIIKDSVNKEIENIEQREKMIKENTLSDAKQSRIKSLIASGKSQEEVAKILGVSTSTVNKYK